MGDRRIETWAFKVEAGGFGGAIDAPWATPIREVGSDATYKYFGQEITVDTCDASILQTMVWVGDTYTAVTAQNPTCNAGWAPRGSDLQSVVGALSGDAGLMRYGIPVLGRVASQSISANSVQIPLWSNLSTGRETGAWAPRLVGRASEPFSVFVGLRTLAASSVDVFGAVYITKGVE